MKKKLDCFSFTLGNILDKYFFDFDNEYKQLYKKKNKNIQNLFDLPNSINYLHPMKPSLVSLLFLRILRDL